MCGWLRRYAPAFCNAERLFATHLDVFLLVFSTAVGEDGGRMEKEIAKKTAPVAVERECPYAIDSEEEAIFRIKNTSLPGNVVKVKNMSWCRLGNHFTALFRHLALGYCCKSKVVSLRRINFRGSRPYLISMPVSTRQDSSSPRNEKRKQQSINWFDTA